jgi:hypothetical protein
MGGLETRLRVVLEDQFVAVVVALLVLAALGGWITYGTYVDPGTSIEEEPGASVRETAAFNHSATVVEENPLFRVGRTLSERSLYYTSLSPVLNGSFTYAYTASDDGSIETAVDLDVVIRSVDEREARRGPVEYWRVTENVSEATRTLEPGQRVSLDFSRNVSALNERASRLAENFSGAGTVGTALVAEVRTQGTVNGEPVDRTRTYRLPVQVEENTYRVEDPGTVTNSSTETREVVVQNSYGPLRNFGAPILFALSFGFAIGLAIARQQGAEFISEAERARLAYESERNEFDDWVTAAAVPDAEFEGSRIEVDSLEGLVDVAIDTNERVMEDRERDLFVVLDDGRHYVYEPPNPQAVESILTGDAESGADGATTDGSAAAESTEDGSDGAATEPPADGASED